MAANRERGRDAYARKDWGHAYEYLHAVDEAAPLTAEDLELLATSAFMLGRDDEYVRLLERAHRAHLEAGSSLRGIRCAFWCGMMLITKGEIGPGGGWIARAQRLLANEEEDCVERGYLLMPLAFQHEAAGDFEAAAALAGEAAQIAERFADSEAFALAGHVQGHMLIRAGRVQEGLALLDEAMLTVTRNELSPIVTGLVYCGVILGCQEVFEVRRAREWTAVLTRWCDEQPGIVAFTGRCLVHRAEILQLSGRWADSLVEAQRARQRFIETKNESRAGLAVYREAEILRLLGELGAAEDAYRDASRFGWEPQPGLAQLRLAQGKHDLAFTTIRRVLDEATEPLRRAALLPAYVEIALSCGDVESARVGCDELERLASDYDSALLAALVAQARAAVHLAGGDARTALPLLRRALDVWNALDAPYEVARARVLVGLACRELGDDDAAALELDAARLAFERLGAQPDLLRVDGLLRRTGGETHGLTGRELEVLRLVSAGKSNREVATELVISEHTVARHLQNIFAKLGVSSRTAAASFAFEHDLV